MSYERIDNRQLDEIRKTKITPHVSPYAEGSALIEVGGTKVLCMATVEEKVPHWMRNSKKGWVTAEYAMLPRSTHTRVRRERPNASGRTMEIQRLIGRSLRAIVDMKNSENVKFSSIAMYFKLMAEHVALQLRELT